MSKIVVVGSSNTDMVVKTERFPQPGETLLGGDFYMFPGGKGANQAVAAARAGGPVAFVCCVGGDLFGQNALKGYEKEGLDVSSAKVVENATSGVALITVSEQGENQIVVASGTNALLSPQHLEALEEIFTVGDIFLTQLETPLETVAFLAEKCRQLNKRLIINPAPAQKLDDDVLQGLYLITPNETETQILTGIAIEDEASMVKAAQGLLQKGIQNVIMTLGSRGSFYTDGTISFSVSSPKVKAQDTTAAGDVYNGVLTVCLAQGKGFRESMSYASKAAAISVTRMGAQDTAPTQEEINQFQ
ncbi:MAG: ribokinase [Bacteroidota bacterium]